MGISGADWVWNYVSILKLLDDMIGTCKNLIHLESHFIASVARRC